MANRKKALVWTTGMLAIIGIIFYIGYNYYHDQASKKEIAYAKEQLAKKRYYNAMVGVGKAVYYKKKNAEAYFIWGQIEIEKHRNYPQAVYCMTKAIEYAKKPTAAMYYLRGKGYYKTQKFKEAIADFEEATQRGGQADSLAYYLKRSKGDLALNTPD